MTAPPNIPATQAPPMTHTPDSPDPAGGTADDRPEAAARGAARSAPAPADDRPEAAPVATSSATAQPEPTGTPGQTQADVPAATRNGRRQLTTNQALTVVVTIGLGLFLYMLNHIDDRFAQVDTRIASVESRIAEVDEEVDGVGRTLAVLIAHLGATQAVEDALTGNVDQLEPAPSRPAARRAS